MSTDKIKEEKEVKTEETETAVEEKAEKKAEPKKESKKAKKDTKKEDSVKEAAEKAIKAEQEKYMRLAAEYDNFRKRSQKEREALYTDIKADTLMKFLPVYDNLERALKQETADEAYRKGVEMIMEQFKATMEKLGVTEIESEGQKFDPEKHNAVMHVDDENYGENEIVEVFQKGFKVGEKVIRFAMVKVAN